MPYERRILRYDTDGTTYLGDLSLDAVRGCWFELHRQGGCGSGEVVLRSEFPDREVVQVGEWLAMEYQDGERWYFGRVENRSSRSPARVKLRLEGPGIQLGEVFPGGFGRSVGDGTPPHRYSRTDLFPGDPDYDSETVDLVSRSDEVVRLLMTQYVVPKTNILYDPALIESPAGAGELTSIKFRGEESARSIIKELAMRSQHASWGVDEERKFFFLRRRPEVIATFRIGQNVTSIEETVDFDLMVNRVVLTGDYIYRTPDSSGGRGFYRWRGNYVQPASRSRYGERRQRMWVPWIRTRDDATEFLREFFRVYAEPPRRFHTETAPVSTLPIPWLGRIRLEDRQGGLLALSLVETIRVQFDHAPKLRFELGPVDSRSLWPEPPHDERWELPGDPTFSGFGGGPISLTSLVWPASSSNMSGSSFDSSGASGSSDPSGGGGSGGSGGGPGSSVLDSSGAFSGTMTSSSDGLSGSNSFSSSSMSGDSSHGISF